MMISTTCINKNRIIILILLIILSFNVSVEANRDRYLDDILWNKINRDIIYTNYDVYLNKNLFTTASVLASNGGTFFWTNANTGSANACYTAFGSYWYVHRCSSTEKDKEEIKDLVIDYENKTEKTLKDKIFSLKPKEYIRNSTGDKEIGLIAEETVDIFPELVIYEMNITDEERNLYKEELPQEILDRPKIPFSINYDQIGVSLIPIIKEQEERINTLEEENTLIKNELCNEDKKYSWC